MSGLELSRGATAMLVVELQNDLVHESLIGSRGVGGRLAEAVKRRGVLERLAEVLTECRARGVPVIYLTKERHPGLPQPQTAPIYRLGRGAPILVSGTWGARVVDEIAPQEGDLVLPRFTSIDPSVGSELWPVLRRLGVTTLVVAGVSTTMAVEGTVRAAANREYRVVVLEDCCASFPDDWHVFSVEKIMPLLADVGPSADALEALRAW